MSYCPRKLRCLDKVHAVYLFICVSIYIVHRLMYMRLTTIVSFDLYVSMSAITLSFLSMGFGNVPVRGSCCQKNLLTDLFIFQQRYS
jgi:hypothetical protein